MPFSTREPRGKQGLHCSATAIGLEIVDELYYRRDTIGRSELFRKDSEAGRAVQPVRRNGLAASGIDARYLWSPSPSAETFSLAEQIAEKIGNAIICGEYAAGLKLHEQQLIERFKVSRGPVRETLRILERDGLVQVAPRRGALVSSLSIAEVKHLFDIRIALFGLAAKVVTERQDADFVEQFVAAAKDLGEIARGGDVDSYVNLAYRLGIWLAEATGNKHLSRMFFSLAHQTLRYARLGLSTGKRREQSARTWRKIASAIRARNPALARRMAEQLLRDSRDMAVRLLERGDRLPM